MLCAQLWVCDYGGAGNHAPRRFLPRERDLGRFASFSSCMYTETGREGTGVPPRDLGLLGALMRTRGVAWPQAQVLRGEPASLSARTVMVTNLLSADTSSFSSEGLVVATGGGGSGRENVTRDSVTLLASVRGGVWLSL